MNKQRYQMFLLTRILQGNDYSSVDELLAAIKAADAIPETEFRARKTAYNAIADKAPLRNISGLAITHSDILAHLESEWKEFNAFSAATKNMTRTDDLETALRGFWLSDADMTPASPGDDDLASEDSPAPR